jgi:hypothetical protein
VKVDVYTPVPGEEMAAKLPEPPTVLDSKVIRLTAGRPEGLMLPKASLVVRVARRLVPEEMEFVEVVTTLIASE